MEVDQQVLRQCLCANGNIVAAWTFGSTHSGRARPGSDIDVGVLFHRQPSLDELVNLRECLQKAFSYEDIDMVVLNDVSPMLGFEAISGALVYVSDRNAQADYVSLTAREYEDEMAQWRMALKGERQKVKDER